MKKVFLLIMFIISLNVFAGDKNKADDDKWYDFNITKNPYNSEKYESYRVGFNYRFVFNFAEIEEAYKELWKVAYTDCRTDKLCEGIYNIDFKVTSSERMFVVYSTYDLVQRRKK